MKNTFSRTRWAVICTLFSLFALSSNALGAERYYMLLFAYQRTPNKPKFGHTFATFVKVSQKDNCPEKVIEHHTISWLPANKRIVVACLLPEKGHNFTWQETMDLALQLNARISMWGPFEIKKMLYERSVRHYRRLMSGKIHYKAFDMGFPNFYCSNCVHAVSDLVWAMPRLRILCIFWGEWATYRVLRRLYLFIKNPKQTHEWVAEALGIDRYPVRRNPLGEWYALIPFP